MKLGLNLQYLRKLHGGMTQEKLAERMNVSRQTVSKWETGEAVPDVEKLLELSRLFSCTLDALLKEDMAPQADCCSPVSIVTVPPFTLGRYIIISPRPENDKGSRNPSIPGSLIGSDFHHPRTRLGAV